MLVGRFYNAADIGVARYSYYFFLKKAMSILTYVGSIFDLIQTLASFLILAFILVFY